LLAIVLHTLSYLSEADELPDRWSMKFINLRATSCSSADNGASVVLGTSLEISKARRWFVFVANHISYDIFIKPYDF